jgi:hypothetical protein
LFNADVANFKANFTVTAAEIATLFGTSTLALNDTYDFAPDIYVGSKKYEAFLHPALEMVRVYQVCRELDLENL